MTDIWTDYPTESQEPPQRRRRRSIGLNPGPSPSPPRDTPVRSSGGPYEVDYLIATARMKAPLTPGMEVPIKVLADDPQRIAVQWDDQNGSIAAQSGDMAVTNVMDNTYASAADTAMRRGPGQASRRRPGHAAEQGQADEGRKPDLLRGVRGEEEGDPR